jgi:hypothetical protein
MSIFPTVLFVLILAILVLDLVVFLPRARRTRDVIFLHGIDQVGVGRARLHNDKADIRREYRRLGLPDPIILVAPEGATIRRETR